MRVRDEVKVTHHKKYLEKREEEQQEEKEANKVIERGEGNKVTPKLKKDLYRGTQEIG